MWVKKTNNHLKLLQDKDMILILEKNLPEVISSVMGDRYLKSDENKKKKNVDASDLYDWSMSQPLSYDEDKFDRNDTSEDILNTPVDSDKRYLIEVDLKFTENIKERT